MSAVEQKIATEIANRHGLSVRGDWSTSIRRCLGELQPVNTLTAQDATAIDTATVDEVAGNLTISETFFMRHHTQIAYAAERIARQLAGGARKVRVLSAGCSSGEEPYSLVICLLRLLGRYRSSQIEIRGCDLSSQAIEKARAAEYGNWSFRGVPAWLLERHFEMVGPDIFRISSDVSERVHFDHSSISDALIGYADESLDVVLFRNVGIYLLEDYRRDLFEQFRRVLRTEGLLIVAPGDPRPSASMFMRLPHESTSIYAALATQLGEQVDQSDQLRRRSADETTSDEGTFSATSSDNASHLNFPSRDVIRTMADRGELDCALELAGQLAARCPSDAEAHLLHGQLHLAGARSDDRVGAIESLRKAVFIAPRHPLARFWYANALISDGRLKKACGQLQALSEILQSFPDGELLGDEPISVAELREVQTFLLEGIA